LSAGANRNAINDVKGTEILLESLQTAKNENLVKCRKFIFSDIEIKISEGVKK